MEKRKKKELRRGALDTPTWFTSVSWIFILRLPTLLLFSLSVCVYRNTWPSAHSSEPAPVFHRSIIVSFDFPPCWFSLTACFSFPLTNWHKRWSTSNHIEIAAILSQIQCPFFETPPIFNFFSSLFLVASNSFSTPLIQHSSQMFLHFFSLFFFLPSCFLALSPPAD